MVGCGVFVLRSGYNGVSGRYGGWTSFRSGSLICCSVTSLRGFNGAYQTPPTCRRCSYKTMSHPCRTSYGRSSNVLRIAKPALPAPTIAMDFGDWALLKTSCCALYSAWSIEEADEDVIKARSVIPSARYNIL